MTRQDREIYNTLGEEQTSSSLSEKQKEERRQLVKKIIKHAVETYQSTTLENYLANHKYSGSEKKFRHSIGDRLYAKLKSILLEAITTNEDLQVFTQNQYYLGDSLGNYFKTLPLATSSLLQHTTVTNIATAVPLLGQGWKLFSNYLRKNTSDDGLKLPEYDKKKDEVLKNIGEIVNNSKNREQEHKGNEDFFSTQRVIISSPPIKDMSDRVARLHNLKEPENEERQTTTSPQTEQVSHPIATQFDESEKDKTRE